jgi:hypothetical protein
MLLVLIGTDSVGVEYQLQRLVTCAPCVNKYRISRQKGKHHTANVPINNWKINYCGHALHFSKCKVSIQIKFKAPTSCCAKLGACISDINLTHEKEPGVILVTRPNINTPHSPKVDPKEGRSTSYHSNTTPRSPSAVFLRGRISVQSHRRDINYTIRSAVITVNIGLVMDMNQPQ